jgi:hypothetical protein
LPTARLIFRRQQFTGNFSTGIGEAERVGVGIQPGVVRHGPHGVAVPRVLRHETRLPGGVIAGAEMDQSGWAVGPFAGKAVGACTTDTGFREGFAEGFCWIGGGYFVLKDFALLDFQTRFYCWIFIYLVEGLCIHIGCYFD